MKFGLVLPQGYKFRISLTGVEFIIIDAMKLGRDKTGLRVQDQWYIRSVVRRMTKEDANPGAVGPFVVCMVCLQIIFQNVNRGTEWMKVVEIGFNLGP